MSIINKPPQHVKREYELEEPVALVVEKYATFIDSTPDHVVNSALKMLLWKDKHFMNWRKQQQQAARKEVPITGTSRPIPLIRLASSCNSNGDQAGALFPRWSKSIATIPIWTSTTSASSTKPARSNHERS
jgi:hypothetical protein